MRFSKTTFPARVSVHYLLRISAAVVCLALTGSTAFAAKTPKKAKAPKFDAVITAELAGLRWGMSPKQVVEVFSAQIAETFREQIRHAGGALEEDQARQQMDAELKKLKSSYVRFDNKPSSWDVSFLKNEFLKNQEEAMIIRKRAEQQDYLFFRQGKLYKWYRALERQSMGKLTYDEFLDAWKQKLGSNAKSVAVEKGVEWVWSGHPTTARAINQSQFYGFYAIVFEDAKIAKQRASAVKANQTGDEKGGNHLVDGIVRDDKPDADPNADVIERMTGKTPAPSAPASGKATKAPATSAPKEQKPSNTGTSKGSNKQKEEDPLSGVAF